MFVTDPTDPLDDDVTLTQSEAEDVYLYLRDKWLFTEEDLEGDS